MALCLHTTSHALTGVKLYALVTLRTASLTFTNPTFCPHSCIYVFCVDLRTAIISLYNINWLVFITEMECVYCEVRTGYLYHSRSGPREICNGQTGTGTEFFPSSSVSRCQHHSTTAALGQTGSSQTNSARPDTRAALDRKVLSYYFRHGSSKFNQTWKQHCSQY